MRPDLDHEDKSTYEVLVEAGDDNGRTAIANVTIMLINLNEEPYFVETSRMLVDHGNDATDEIPTMLVDDEEYPENSTAAVASYQVVDPDGMDINWAVTGTDAADFTITMARSGSRVSKL